MESSAQDICGPPPPINTDWEHADGHSPRHFTWRSWLLGIVIVSALIGAVLHFEEIRYFTRIAAHARPAWLVAALVLQLSTYASVASGWGAVLRRAGTPLPLSGLMRIAVNKLFTDQIFPTAGIGGNIVVVDQLIRSGVPRGSAVATLMVSMVGFYAAFAGFAVLTLVLLWLHDKATPLMAGTVTTFLIVALTIPSLALWLRHRGSQPFPPQVERIAIMRNLLDTVADAPSYLVNDRRLLAGVAGFNVLVFLADAATLYVCLRALGEYPAFGTAIIGLIMASIVATLGPVPLGLGTFEASCTATIHLLGIPVVPAFTATMLLRILTMWLPMMPGLVLMRSAAKRPKVEALGEQVGKPDRSH